MRLLIGFWEILFHSSRLVISKCWTINKGIALIVRHHPSVSQTCTIGFKSQEDVSHSICCIVSTSNIFSPVKLYQVCHYHALKKGISYARSVRYNIRSNYFVCIFLNHQSTIPLSSDFHPTFQTGLTCSIILPRETVFTAQ